jgi:hypothetical protein
MTSRPGPWGWRRQGGLVAVFLFFCLGYIQAAGAAPPVREPGAGESLAYKIHAVRPGDTLEKIAGRPEFYGDRLKWFLVYFQNREELAALRLDPDEAAATLLRPGLALALLPPSQLAGSAQKATCCGQVYWVINIRSSLDPFRLNRLLLQIMDLGDFAYLSTYLQRGKTWYRLRVGFFDSQEAAASRAGQLGARLGLTDLWVAKAAASEVREYIGFVWGMKSGPP